MFYPCTESLIDAKNCSSKRVSRACDRCRLKKTKCDGRRCCNRCLADDAICVFSKRKRSADRPYSPEYVQLLEDQQMKLVEGVQELYRRLRRGECWDGPMIAEDSQGYPLVQDVLDALAVLAPCERSQARKKADEKSMSDQDNEDDDEDDEDEQSSRRDGSGRVSSTPPPPLTPLDAGHSSDTHSLGSDYSVNGFSIPHGSIEYGQEAGRLLNTGPIMCLPDELLQHQALESEGGGFWPVCPSFDVAGDVAAFADLIDPFINTPASCNWYQGSYMV